MLKLVWKDVFIQKRTLIFGVLFFFYFMIAFQKIGAAGLTGGIVCLTYVLPFGISAIEDKNKVEIMLNSLPIKRSTVVLSKYLSVFIYTTVILLACYFTYGLTKWLELPIKVVPFTIEGALGGIIAMALLTSINFPLIFKYGYIKSRVANFALFFLFFFGGNVLMGYVQDHHLFAKLMDVTGHMTMEQISILLMIPTIIILIISMTISIKIYQHREFY